MDSAPLALRMLSRKTRMLQSLSSACPFCGRLQVREISRPDTKRAGRVARECCETRGVIFGSILPEIWISTRPIEQVKKRPIASEEIPDFGSSRILVVLSCPYHLAICPRFQKFLGTRKITILRHLTTRILAQQALIYRKD